VHPSPVGHHNSPYQLMQNSGRKWLSPANSSGWRNSSGALGGLAAFIVRKPDGCAPYKARAARPSSARRRTGRACEQRHIGSSPNGPALVNLVQRPWVMPPAGGRTAATPPFLSHQARSLWLLLSLPHAGRATSAAAHPHTRPSGLHSGHSADLRRRHVGQDACGNGTCISEDGRKRLTATGAHRLPGAFGQCVLSQPNSNRPMWQSIRRSTS
jgi:hypothetical protein